VTKGMYSDSETLCVSDITQTMHNVQHNIPTTDMAIVKEKSLKEDN
jgi:hypothetical protein